MGALGSERPPGAHLLPWVGQPLMLHSPRKRARQGSFRTPKPNALALAFATLEDITFAASVAEKVTPSRSEATPSFDTVWLFPESNAVARRGDLTVSAPSQQWRKIRLRPLFLEGSAVAQWMALITSLASPPATDGRASRIAKCSCVLVFAERLIVFDTIGLSILFPQKAQHLVLRKT